MAKSLYRQLRSLLLWVVIFALVWVALNQGTSSSKGRVAPLTTRNQCLKRVTFVGDSTAMRMFFRFVDRHSSSSPSAGSNARLNCDPPHRFDRVTKSTPEIHCRNSDWMISFVRCLRFAEVPSKWEAVPRRGLVVLSVGLWDSVRPLGVNDTILSHGSKGVEGWLTGLLSNVSASFKHVGEVRTEETDREAQRVLLLPPGPVNCSAERFRNRSAWCGFVHSVVLPAIGSELLRSTVDIPTVTLANLSTHCTYTDGVHADETGACEEGETDLLGPAVKSVHCVKL
jgi:hypothetical protein